MKDRMSSHITELIKLVCAFWFEVVSYNGISVNASVFASVAIFETIIIIVY